MKKLSIFIISFIVFVFVSGCALQKPVAAETNNISINESVTAETNGASISVEPPTLEMTFQEVDPYSKDRISIYKDVVKKRLANEDFLTCEEIQLLEEAGYSVCDKGRVIFRYSSVYHVNLKERIYPLLLKHENSILLWSIAGNGQLFIEDLEGLKEGYPSSENHDKELGFCGNVHYQGTDQIVETDWHAVYSYNKESGQLFRWEFGECMYTFRAAPAGATYFGHSEGLGFVFTEEDRVYQFHGSRLFQDEGYQMVAENVDAILTLTYRSSGYPFDYPLFLMKNGELRICVSSRDGAYELRPIK